MEVSLSSLPLSTICLLLLSSNSSPPSFFIIFLFHAHFYISLTSIIFLTLVNSVFSFSFYSTINEEITAMKVFYLRVKSPAKLLLIRGFMGMAWVFNLWMETSNKSWVFNLWVVEEIPINSLPFLCLFSLLFFLLLGIIVFRSYILLHLDLDL